MNNSHKSKAVDKKFENYEHLDKIGEIAVYYGFNPSKSPVVSKSDIDLAKDLFDGDTIDDETNSHDRLSLHAEEKIALLRMYQEENMYTEPQPVMLYFKDPYRGSIKKSGYHRYADLEILGSSGSIAEAILIQTTRAILNEEGYKNTIVEINSVGDKDAQTSFIRELTTYYRKHMNNMSANCRELFKKDPVLVLQTDDPACKELNEKAPKSLDFLPEISRRHLEEVLEYMEALTIPYVINNSLIGNRKYCMETIFTISNTDKDASQKILAVGVRYNNLAKRLNMKKDIQGVGMSILIKNNKTVLKKNINKIKRPIASFIQLGIESKLIALNVVESLRKTKIPLYLSLARDRLGAQVSCIEKHHTPYIIVMGKKEAVEKNVIVRETDTHAQETVPLCDLPKYMKKVEEEYWKK